MPFFKNQMPASSSAPSPEQEVSFLERLLRDEKEDHILDSALISSSLSILLLDFLGSVSSSSFLTQDM